ncbi:hypothetical protein M8818_006941 [Zalaria obscura]|uniref:Uncharacterized protein n=1 Tax=Zalaria obscura TaxID=2024903 RepID=A0ACC3S762_9PEZI
MPFLGILEDKALPHVPGTVILDEAQAHSGDVTGNLKHGRGKNSHIVLVPQPSDDPNDPLNWPQSKKILCMAIVGFGAMLYAGTIGPLTNAGLAVIAADFKTEIGAIVLDNGYQVLVVGGTGPIISALARKYGKRPCFLFSGLACLVGSIVGSTAKNEAAYLTARTVQGFAVTAYESLIFTIVGDLFFVHERGLYISIGSFLLAGIANLCSIVTGPITNSLGWKYLFHFFILFGGIQFLLQLLFVPETQFRRDHRNDIDELVEEDLAVSNKGATTTTIEKAGSPSPPSLPPRKTWREELAIFTGTYSTDSFLQLIIAPFAICLNLAALWVILVAAFFVGEYVIVAYVLAQLFSVPPYNLTAAGVGYLSLGPLIGGILASLTLALVSDPIIRWATRRNRGVYEPEYRLIPLLPAVAIGPALIGFGYVTQAGQSLYGAAFLYGLAVFSIMFVLTQTNSYALDAYRGMSNEIFIASMAAKNFLLFPYSYFINDYMAREGPVKVFTVFGGIGIGLLVTMPVVFVWGKRYRSFWARHDLLEKFHIKTHQEI